MKNILTILLILVTGWLFWKGFEITEYFHHGDAIAATDMRYNIFAIVITLAYGISLIPGKSKLATMLIWWVFWLAACDIPFRIMGYNQRENGDNEMVIISLALTVAVYIYQKLKTPKNTTI